jgi:hypothetical protein
MKTSILSIVLGMLIVGAYALTTTAQVGESNAAQAESSARTQLRTIATAEVVYLESYRGKYATIPEMISAGVLDRRFEMPVSGYSFDVKLQLEGKTYFAIATPVDNVGRYAYFITTDAVVRFGAGPEGTPIGQPVR